MRKIIINFTVILVILAIVISFVGCGRKLISYGGSSEGLSSWSSSGLTPPSDDSDLFIDDEGRDGMGDKLRSEYDDLIGNMEEKIEKGSAEYNERLLLANEYAKAKKNRDGRAEYELYSKELKEQLLPEFERVNWVTGTSSPYIKSHLVAFDNGNVKVTFDYVTSSGPYNKIVETLSFEREDGNLVISKVA